MARASDWWWRGKRFELSTLRQCSALKIQSLVPGNFDRRCLNCCSTVKRGFWKLLSTKSGPRFKGKISTDTTIFWQPQIAEGRKLNIKGASRSIKKGMFRSIMTKQHHKVINPSYQGEISGLTDGGPAAVIIRKYCSCFNIHSVN